MSNIATVNRGAVRLHINHHRSYNCPNKRLPAIGMCLCACMCDHPPMWLHIDNTMHCSLHIPSACRLIPHAPKHDHVHTIAWSGSVTNSRCCRTVAFNYACLLCMLMGYSNHMSSDRVGHTCESQIFVLPLWMAMNGWVMCSWCGWIWHCSKMFVPV